MLLLLWSVSNYQRWEDLHDCTSVLIHTDTIDVNSFKSKNNSRKNNKIVEKIKLVEINVIKINNK